MNQGTSTKPLVSVIIPVFNTPKQYLLECLVSVRNQDHPNLEVILVDDGSADEIAKALDSFVQSSSGRDASSIKWAVIHQKNQGLSAARNAGYNIASGEYVQFLDSDDHFDCRLISVAVEKAENANADIVIENFIVQDVTNKTEQVVLDSKISFAHKRWFKLHDLENHRLSTLPYSAWSKLFRKSFLDRNDIMHDNSLLRAEDVLFSCSAFILAKRITVMLEPYITYRDNLPTSNSQTNDKFPSESVRSWRKLYDFLNKHKVYDTYRRDFEEAMLSSVYWHLSRLRTPEGKGELARATQDFINACGVSVINDYSIVIATTSIDPGLAAYFEEENKQMNERLTNANIHVATLSAELESLRAEMANFVGIKRSMRLLAGNVKRRLIRDYRKVTRK